MTILVTGAKGMIGSQLVRGLLDAGYTVIGVDRVGEEFIDGQLYHFNVDLSDKERLRSIVENNKVDRLIHLAALAHKNGENDLSWERYKHINVDCARNVFEVAGERPVLYISTVDVFGFFDGKEPLNGDSEIHPVSKYGKSKALAETECKKLPHFTIYRLSPVYIDSSSRDIQKRYYLKYPKIVYQVGKGTAFEILNIYAAVAAMVAWCSEEPKNDIKIIKDEKMMWTPEYIKAEREKGNGKVKIWFPRWMVCFGYTVLRAFFGKNEKIYLLNKAVHPLRTE